MDIVGRTPVLVKNQPMDHFNRALGIRNLREYELLNLSCCEHNSRIVLWIRFACLRLRSIQVAFLYATLFLAFFIPLQGVRT